MPQTEISPKTLRAAARQLWELEQFLSHCMQAKVMPLLVGYDLGDLACRFDDAAAEMMKAARTK